MKKQLNEAMKWCDCKANENNPSMHGRAIKQCSCGSGQTHADCCVSCCGEGGDGQPAKTAQTPSIKAKPGLREVKRAIAKIIKENKIQKSSTINEAKVCWCPPGSKPGNGSIEFGVSNCKGSCVACCKSIKDLLDKDKEKAGDAMTVPTYDAIKANIGTRDTPSVASSEKCKYRCKNGVVVTGNCCSDGTACEGNKKIVCGDKGGKSGEQTPNNSAEL